MTFGVIWEVGHKFNRGKVFSVNSWLANGALIFFVVAPTLSQPQRKRIRLNERACLFRFSLSHSPSAVAN